MVKELKTSRHKTKRCAICGKTEKSHWRRHWARQHPGEEPRELKEGKRPRDANFKLRTGKFDKFHNPHKSTAGAHSTAGAQSTVTEAK